jgi:soluble lytic murein transglycosylase
MRLRLIAAAAFLASALVAAPGAHAHPHTVQPGESLWAIGQANGLPPARLAEANGLSVDGILYAGYEIEVPLSLRHEDIIRQQAEEKDLDPTLIAAVIYEESGFRPRTSPAGAKGLMQIIPETAWFIAHKSGGTAFVLGDLATPQVNISYGSWYLRYQIDLYDGDETLGLAAYNAGEANVDRWVAAAGGIDEFDPAEDIPFPETRDYVLDVAEKRELYEERYARELGL